ncbi:acyltransferase [Intrasporangium oryzae NRRL B-24470]|uniref:Diacylglycerol O-acyltransferase n=1 Tax=Intrasporangium oryzae NRRL B-24470 TaxID=1386089 RepID=W9G0S0_9MICO|nr:wax ester/triacylglycerol synthase family O-acyltransferase [Intrasporangium oryzae]EWS99675.1 acyltransferase [Intrasporangium oryzae NRRL B-24470]
MDTLKPLDAAFLDLERSVQQLNVGSVMIFEGPAPTLARIRSEFEALLPALPRYRQRVRRVPLDLGLPRWVDDPAFDLDHHVQHLRLRAGASDEQLRTVAVGLISAPLDLEHPLWRCWLLTGLEGGRWALANTNHHAMIDGISGADIIGLMLRADRDVPRRVSRRSVTWHPGASPSSVRLAAEAGVDLLRSPLVAARRLTHALLPWTVRESLVEAYGVARAGEQVLHPELGLTGHLGPHRSWGWVRADLSDVKAVKTAHGGTVNDVVLAATAGGFRALLEARGKPVDGRTVRSMVPVSVRHADEHGTLGNRVSAVLADLPVGIADPIERLHAVTAQLSSLKAGGTVLGLDALLDSAELVPGPLYALGVRLWARTPQRVISTVTTNIPGPQVPLYLLGRRLTDLYPYIPLGVDIRITIGIASYAGQLAWGVTADSDSVTDLQVLCDGIETSLAELVQSIPTPSARQAHHA